MLQRLTGAVLLGLLALAGLSPRCAANPPDLPNHPPLAYEEKVVPPVPFIASGIEPSPCPATQVFSTPLSQALTSLVLHSVHPLLSLLPSEPVVALFHDDSSPLTAVQYTQVAYPLPSTTSQSICPAESQAAQVAQGPTVLQNLQALEEAATSLQEAHHLAQCGHIPQAMQVLNHVRQLCPGASVQASAEQAIAQLQRGQCCQTTASTDKPQRKPIACVKFGVHFGVGKPPVFTMTPCVCPTTTSYTYSVKDTCPCAAKKACSCPKGKCACATKKDCCCGKSSSECCAEGKWACTANKGCCAKSKCECCCTKGCCANCKCACTANKDCCCSKATGVANPSKGCSCQVAVQCVPSCGCLPLCRWAMQQCCGCDCGGSLGLARWIMGHMTQGRCPIRDCLVKIHAANPIKIVGPCHVCTPVPAQPQKVFVTSTTSPRPGLLRVVRVMVPPTPKPVTTKDSLDRCVTLHVSEVSLAKVLGMLHEQTGCPMLFVGTCPNVSVSAANMPARLVLEHLASAYGLAVSIESEGVILRPVSSVPVKTESADEGDCPKHRKRQQKKSRKAVSSRERTAVEAQVSGLMKACYLAIWTGQHEKAADLARQAHALDPARVESDPIVYKLQLLHDCRSCQEEACGVPACPASSYRPQPYHQQ
jgi:hypothetical protein